MAVGAGRRRPSPAPARLNTAWGSSAQRSRSFPQTRLSSSWRGCTTTFHFMELSGTPDRKVLWQL